MNDNSEQKAKDLISTAEGKATNIIAVAVDVATEKEQQSHDAIITEMKEHFDDMFMKTYQSGKSETSGIVADIIRKMDNSIELSVRRHVNGNIIGLKTLIDNYIKEDEEWKKRAEPVIKMGENAQGTSKFVLYLSGLILAMGGAYLMVRNLIK